jgi:hypothetical protein
MPRKKVGAEINDKSLAAVDKLLDEGERFDKASAPIGICEFGVHAAEATPVLRKSLFPSDAKVSEISAEALGKSMSRLLSPPSSFESDRGERR